MTNIQIAEDAIIARETAYGMSPDQTTTVPIKTVEKVLIEGAGGNEEEWFRCAYPNVICGFASDVVRSVTSHQRSHSPKARVAKLEAKKAAQRTNRSQGVRTGVEARRERVSKMSQQDPNDVLNAIAARLLQAVDDLRTFTRAFKPTVNALSSQRIAELELAERKLLKIQRDLGMTNI